MLPPFFSSLIMSLVFGHGCLYILFSAIPALPDASTYWQCSYKGIKEVLVILSHSQGDSDLSMHSCVVLFYALAFFFHLLYCFPYCIVSHLPVSQHVDTRTMVPSAV